VGVEDLTGLDVEADAAAAGDRADVLDSAAAGAHVVRGGVLRAGGYVSGTLLSLIGVAVVTRHLGLAEYGRYQTIISLITVVGAVTDAGMGTLGLREYSQRQGADRVALMRSLLGLRLVLTAVGVVLALGIALAAGYASTLVAGTVFAGAGLVLTVAQGTLSIPLGAGLRNGTITAMDFLRQALTVAAFVVLAVAGAGTAAFLAVPIPVGAVLVVAVALLVRSDVSLRPRMAVSEWGALLRSSIAFALASAVGTIYIYTAQILTSFVTDERQVGLFAASFRVFIVVVAIPALLVTVAFPVLARAARDDHGRLAYAVSKLLDVSVLLGFGAALGLLTAAPAIIDVMAGPKFAAATTSLRILGGACLCSFLLATWGFALLSLHLHRSLLRANFAALVVSLVSVSLLAAHSGANGAAVGVVLGETTLGIGYMAGLTRGRPELRPTLRVPIRAALAAGLAAGVVIVLGLPPLPAGVVALVLYVGGLLALRAVPEELLRLLPTRG
jgi:O-antigen/teichoic acid export membrane protein